MLKIGIDLIVIDDIDEWQLQLYGRSMCRSGLLKKIFEWFLKNEGSMGGHLHCGLIGLSHRYLRQASIKTCCS